ncbi:MAG: redoxin domain-containing protein [Bdellovibrionaceae bacterium]|nr:redoxin domain-containing protein [Pseudobdellovibrionaceae bacterium]
MTGRVFWVLCTLLIFTQCGIRDGFEQPIGENKKVRVYLFSAQWCDSCKDEMIDLDRLLKTEFKEKAAQVLVTVYTVTDVRKFPPNQAAADAFQKEMADLHDIHFETVVDPWIYQNYRLYFDWNGGDIPAVVVLNEAGDEVLKKFRPGSGFTANDIIDFLWGALS